MLDADRLVGQKSSYDKPWHWLVIDPTRERNLIALMPSEPREKGQLGQRKGPKTKAVVICLPGAGSPRTQAVQTQLAFFVFIELEGSQGSLYDCKSGKCKWLWKSCNIKLSHWNWANPGQMCQTSTLAALLAHSRKWRGGGVKQEEGAGRCKYRQ